MADAKIRTLREALACLLLHLVGVEGRRMNTLLSPFSNDHTLRWEWIYFGVAAASLSCVDHYPVDMVHFPEQWTMQRQILDAKAPKLVLQPLLADWLFRLLVILVLPCVLLFLAMAQCREVWHRLNLCVLLALVVAATLHRLVNATPSFADGLTPASPQASRDQ
jgi:hypothetical protein